MTIQYVNYLNLSKITVMNMIKKIFIETKVNLIWLRIFYAYGKGQRTGSLIPYIINNLKSNKKVNIKNFDTKMILFILMILQI